MKSAGKARSNGLYRHIRTSKEIIRNLLNYSTNNNRCSLSEIFLSLITVTHYYFITKSNWIFKCVFNILHRSTKPHSRMSC